MTLTTTTRAKGSGSGSGSEVEGEGDKKKSDFDNGSGFSTADDWINNWKAGNFPRAKGWKYGDVSDAGTGTFTEAVNAAPADDDDPLMEEGTGGEGETTDDEDDDYDASRENMYGGDPNAYAYIFCHNLQGPPEDSFACMYLRDVLGAVGVDLVTPDLTRRTAGAGGDKKEEQEEEEDYTVTSAVAALEAAVAAVPEEKRPVRIIGSSLGAYVAAVYASKPENHDNVDSIMLLAPTFNLESIIDAGKFEEELDANFSAAFRADAANHPAFPFLRCRAYVVHGYDDEAAPLENSLTWVRDASVNMRAGATDNAGEEVAERRLLEVGGMGHGIENALPQIKAKLTEYFKLPFVLPEGLE